MAKELPLAQRYANKIKELANDYRQIVQVTVDYDENGVFHRVSVHDDSVRPTFQFHTRQREVWSLADFQRAFIADADAWIERRRG